MLETGFPMSPKKLRGRKAKTAGPEWSQKIMNFRNGLNLSQSELAKRLGSSAMGVSRWERGSQEPPADIYIRLGNLAGDPLCWYFWGCARLVTADVMRVLPAARQRLHETGFPKVRVVHAGSRRRFPPPISLPFLSSPSMLELPGNQSTTMLIWSK